MAAGENQDKGLAEPTVTNQNENSNGSSVYSNNEKGETTVVENIDSPEKEYISPEARALGMSQVMYEATYGENRIPTWSKGHLKLFGIAFLLYMYSSFSGFDGAVMSSINVMPKYLEYFNLEQTGANTGIIFSIGSISSIAAAAFVWLADFLGRRWTIMIGLVGTIVGVVLVSLADNISYLVGARFVLFFFTAIGYNSVPAFLVEIAPPNLRGSISMAFNSFYFVGSTVATLACYGSKINYEDDIKQFKVPFWCQIIAPTLIAVGAIFCPESPRWLIAHGKVDKAREVLRIYHADGDGNHPIIDAQMEEIKAELALSPINSFKDYFNFWSLFNSRSKRYRMFLACAWSWMGNFTGSQVITYYIGVMLDDLGIKSEDTKLLLNAVYSIVGLVFATSGVFLFDVLGRRKMLLISTGGIVLCFAAVCVSSAFYQKYGNSSSSIASISFIYMFGAIFAFCYTPMQPIYQAEVTTNAMRAKCYVFYAILFNVAGFILGFFGSIAMEKMKWGFYLFFVGWNSFTFTIIYFFFVETKGRTLEELDEVFHAKNPRKASLIKKQYSSDSDA